MDKAPKPAIAGGALVSTCLLVARVIVGLAACYVAYTLRTFALEAYGNIIHE